MPVAVEEIPAERFSDRQSYQAMLNVLEDFDEDRLRATQTNSAILNILEDFDVDRGYSSDTNRAVINILEDLDEERALTKTLNTQLEERVLQRTVELTHSEERFRLLVEGVKDYAIFMLDPDGNVLTWNAGAERLKNYRAEEIVGQHFSCFYAAEDQAIGKPQSELSKALLSGSFEDEGMRVRKDGSRFVANVVITAVYDESGRHLGFAKITRDISERVAAQTQKLEAVRREVLLKEIHHRVKNNLQVISSLLFLQSANVSDPNTLAILKESQSRVKSIALIHEKLYRSTDFAKLDFAEYVRDLSTDLFRTYDVNQEGVTFHTKIENVFLEIDTAIPCGLIINELVSNALKYAFPPGKGGELKVELAPVGDGGFVLMVQDNGVGWPKNFDWRRCKSLGLKLVMDLTKQLEGKIEVDTTQGTAFKITFRELQYKERG